MKKYAFILLLFYFVPVRAQLFKWFQERYNHPVQHNVCVKAHLDGDKINYGQCISRKATGIITVEKETPSDILFNITLKSNINRKNEPPIYLRFIKIKSIDVADILSYAEEGDEIFIEEYIDTKDKVNLRCVPLLLQVD